MPLLECSTMRKSTCSLKFQNFCSEIDRWWAERCAGCRPDTSTSSRRRDSSGFQPLRSLPLKSSMGLPSFHDPSSLSAIAGRVRRSNGVGGGAARRCQRAFQFAVDEARAVDGRGTLGIAARVAMVKRQFAVLHGDGVHVVHVAAIGADELAGGLGDPTPVSSSPPGARTRLWCAR